MTPQPFSRSTPQPYGGSEKNMRIELVRSKLMGLSENSDENLSQVVTPECLNRGSSPSFAWIPAKNMRE
jgi:hypothetical protein